MADGDGDGQNVQTVKTASFKIPRPWDSNAPRFLTEDHEDLLEYVDYCEEIMKLGGLTSEKDKKELFTSYLPKRKKDNWRSMKA